MIVLTGFMGAGKSTIGAALARELGTEFWDSDRAIVDREGRSIDEIFSTEGEAGFRKIETALVQEILTQRDGVLALGGGALTPEVRSALDGHIVVMLEVDPDDARTRIQRSPQTRPLAGEDLEALLTKRTPVYREVATLTVTGGRVDDIAKRIATVAGGLRSVKVALPGRPYQVIVGSSAIEHLDLLVSVEGAEKAVVISHPSLKVHSSRVRAALTGIRTELLEIPEGESSKNLDVAARLLEDMASKSVHRNDLVVTVGGGVVSDLGGYVASVYGRGLRVVHVPTTLLGQVDAAIGGKTGVNLTLGKNLVGTFHQPRAVICDVSVLETLPSEELTSGLAEVIKYGLIADPSIIDYLSTHGPAIARREAAALVPLVEASVRVKARIVAADERESGIRAFLNYGHTFAHAFETATEYSLRHGDAVSLGMMAAAYVAEETGRIDGSYVELHRRTLHDAGLPVSASFRIDELEPAWRLDKKYAGGVRFVLLRGPADPEAGVSVERGVLKKALERLAG